MRLSNAKPGWTMFSVFVILTLMLAACAPAAAPKPTIKLASNAWDGSRVNVQVAKILLEKELGYKVEVVDIDEFAQFPPLAEGELSATLEIWPSGHAQDRIDYIDTGKLEDLGPLGVVGKIGWYIPTYLLSDHPELATWEGIKSNAALFKTAETGEQGQFVGADPSFVQYDEHIITNLGLDFKVVYAGSEQAVLSALDAAYSRQQPIVFYFWRPHPAFVKYDLTAVELPDYSDACYAKAPEGVDCDYPPDVLYKAANAKLKTDAPEAHTFLKNMNYTTEDQLAMLRDVTLNGKTPAEAAQIWVDANKAKWEKWLPAK